MLLDIPSRPSKTAQDQCVMTIVDKLNGQEDGKNHTY